MAAVQLTVTPGTTFADTSVVDATKLNLAANPSVTVPDGAGIGPEHLDMAAVTEELGAAVRGINYITRPAFWTQDWEEVDGKSCPVGEWTENSLDWYCRPTGAAVDYNRVQDSPDTKTLYAVELVGATSVTETEFAVWVPSCILSQLRGEDVVFSLYCKNMTTDPMFVEPFLMTADEEDTRPTVTEILTGDIANLVEGEWQRVEFSLLAADYDTFKFGAYFGIRTSELTGPLKSLRIAQAQLELSLVATEFKRPVLPSTPREDLVLPTEFGGDDKLTGGWLNVFIKNSVVQRYLGAPPVSMITPALGWNKAGGYPEWFDTGSNILVLNYTGVDQIFEVPAGITTMECKVWGAGASSDAIGASVVLSGGVGGYTSGTFTVVPGTKYTAVVGYGKHNLAGRAYGFGGLGQGAAHQHAGGGLSGIFTGITPVLVSDAARALVVAGGGGAGGQSGGGSNGVQGGNGNDPGSSGGKTDFQGNDSTGGVSSGGGGGGGGYVGGIALGLGGKGGTGFLHGSATAGAVQYAVRPSLVVPNSGDPDYDSPAGLPGNPGLIIIKWS